MAPDRAELASCALFAGTAWLGIVTMRKYSLQALFSYHGWMHETRGKVSLTSRTWGLLVKLLIGSKPKLFSYQNSLPYLPVPKLNDTMTRVSLRLVYLGYITVRACH
jgi:carnitine O-palmitoyltransferase 1